MDPSVVKLYNKIKDKFQENKEKFYLIWSGSQRQLWIWSQFFKNGIQGHFEVTFRDNFERKLERKFDVNVVKLWRKIKDKIQEENEEKFHFI